jgi:predicted Rossmann-fold nucleotide-binding protein
MAVLMLDLWAVADGVLNGGGTVIGVILILRSKEIAHNGLTELIVVDSMHERKTKMICVTALLLSRGFGTLEEFF